ncbi:ParB/RepB/Spo0J family partition protein [Nostoc sp. FACHB-152]|nr:ParB/RepB/Spo0J family partition protein [Nostoc sp. FACHB-152]
MMNRRKLKDNIANNEELSFVFGKTTAQEIIKTTKETKEEILSPNDIVCTFTFIPDSKPVRHYYDPEELQKWALNDIQPNGIRSPLWVRPHPSQPGKYELVAGLRRLKAAAIVRLETVPVKVFDWDDQTAFHAAISENTNRRDFSALEELDNTLRLLELQLGYDTEKVISLLYRMNNATKSNTNQNVLVSEEAEIVRQVFDSFGRISWQSFVATRLPLLKKPVDILNAIRQGKIHYTKGILLASVKDEDVRRNLLQEAVKNSLSLTEIKQRIKILTSSKTQTLSGTINLKQRLTKTVQMASKNKSLWSDPHKTQQIEQLLNELEAIVTNQSK